MCFGYFGLGTCTIFHYHWEIFNSWQSVVIIKYIPVNGAVIEMEEFIKELPQLKEAVGLTFKLITSQMFQQ